MKALIGDSDFASRSVLAAALTALGYEAVTCCTVTEVRDAFSNDFYALVFLNVDETDDAPLAICQWLRSHSSGEIVWIVALTSNAGMIDPAFKAGANDVLLKPINTAAARARILVGSQEIDRLRERREERDAAADRASTRAQQQVAVAALGQWALVTADVEMLIGQAILFVAQFLEVECCGFFALLPESGELLLRDGAGWLDGYVGSARIPANPGSAEGGAIRQEPVIVEDWEKQTRFQMPSLYREHQIRCSLIVLIPGAAAPVGVLAAHATHRREFSEDDIHFLQAVAVVLSLAIERKRSEGSIQRLANFPRCNPNPVLELTDQAHLAYANEAAEEMARSFGCNSVVELLPGGYAEIVRNSLASGEGLLRQQVVLARRTLAWSFFPISANQLVHCYAEEITNRLDLESQLRQLQKMECVGQLAAGLAHDFNNVLTIVRGHAELILMDQTLAPKRISSLNKILGAVERASSLTRQLLTFSRRQLVQTKALDLNDCLASIVKMMDHMLGENIELIFEPSRDLPTVLGDSGMLDQVVMNLAVNARDAMPKGGRLALTTSLVEVDKAYAQRHSQAREGRFACLNVTDTGSGMDAATLSHIFEPFFTTKGVGRGTGLGLATVYSIIKQHQGWVEVSSRVGQGTTFLIFLPCADSAASARSAPSDPEAVRCGDETILLVEDEPNLRELARMILQSYGYKVLEAGSGVEAVKLWAKEQDRINLLVTDLVMPEGITGLDLARKLAAQKASLKIVFASGYSSELIGKQGLQDQDCFLQKPYAAQALARAVREALDGVSPRPTLT